MLHCVELCYNALADSDNQSVFTIPSLHCVIQPHGFSLNLEGKQPVIRSLVVRLLVRVHPKVSGFDPHGPQTTCKHL